MKALKKFRYIRDALWDNDREPSDYFQEKIIDVLQLTCEWCDKHTETVDGLVRRHCLDCEVRLRCDDMMEFLDELCAGVVDWEKFRLYVEDQIVFLER